MRRTRENSWQYLLFVIPAVVAILGVQYLIRKPHKTENPTTVAVATNDAKTNEASAQAKVVASPHARSARDRDDDDQAEPAAGPEDSDTARSPKDNVVRASHVKEALSDNECKSMEIPGEGSKAAVSAEDWNLVLAQFRGVKNDLAHYLLKNKNLLPETTFTLMNAQIENLKIQRPPIDQQPDLNWRGIGIYSQGATPMIQVGSGFLKLVKQDPVRFKFELARLAAQAWAPCEMIKADSSEPWKEMLSCLGIDNSQGCATGAYSEAGWAVSTVVASIVAPPGCTVPALAAGAQTGHCVNTPPHWQLATREVASEKHVDSMVQDTKTVGGDSSSMGHSITPKQESSAPEEKK